MEFKGATEDLISLLKNKGYIRGPFGSALKRADMSDVGIPVYEQSHVINQGRIFRYFISNAKVEKLKRFFVEENDLIISCSGTVGKVSIIDKNDEKGIISQALLILRPDIEKVLPKYLLYILSSYYGYQSLTSISTGSVQVNLAPRGVVEKIQIPMYPIEKQKKITDILSAFDNKIELNNKMNQTLEDMATELFIDSLKDKKTFTETTLEDLVDIKYGKDHKHLEDGNIPLYGSGGIMRYVNNFLYDKESILIPRKGTLGNLFFIQKPFWTVDTIFYTKINTAKVIPIYLYYLLKRFDLANLNVGSAVPSLTKQALNALKLEIPNIIIQKKVSDVLTSLHNKILDNIEQNQTLTKQRDTLLPKLISGEIKV